MKKFILLVFLPILISGCKGFLDKAPLGPSNSSDYFNTAPANPELAVNAIYDAISWDNGGRDKAYQGYELFFGDICSDDAEIGSKPGDGLINTLRELKEWRANSSHVSTQAVWVNMYAAITRANYVLTYIDQAQSVNQLTKDRLKGEALFLRSYAYFYLARLYGGVPLIDHLLLPSEYGKIQRSSLPQTFIFIENDLNKAKELLPETYASKDAGRATKGAALSYLARCIMYQIGTDNSNGHTWNQVYDLTNMVTQSGVYSLVPNYATLFEDEMENGPESIFEIQYMDNGAGNSDGPISTGSYADQLQNPRSTWGWGYNSPSQSFINAFEPGDPRLPCTVLRNGDILYGKKFTINSAEDATGTLNRKAALAQQASYMSNGPRNHRKMRYADVILMHAEAAFYLGKLSEAMDDINKIRARAKASTLPKGSIEGNPGTYAPANVPDNTLQPVTNLSGQSLLEAIWQERRVELGMETLRFWDLVRTNRYLPGLSSGIAVNCNSHSITANNTPIPLFPIPIGEIQFGLTQNPGY